MRRGYQRGHHSVLEPSQSGWHSGQYLRPLPESMEIAATYLPGVKPVTIAEATLVNDDVLNLDSLLTAEELELRARVRAFVTERIRPNISAWYEQAHFPLELVPELGELGVLGMHLEGYGCCPGRSAVEYGLAAMELEAGDSGLRTFVSVQGSLAMSAIHKWGLRGAEERAPPGDGTGRKDRLLRADRAYCRLRPVQYGDFCGARRPRRLDH